MDEVFGEPTVHYPFVKTGASPLLATVTFFGMGAGTVK
jgi:hypothetical protein